MPHKDSTIRAAYRRAYEASHRKELDEYQRAYRVAHREERRAKARAYAESHRSQRAAYHAEHRKERAELNREWVVSHRDERAAYMKAWEATHREERAEANRKWRESHQDERDAYTRKYKEENRDVVRARDVVNSHNRRARKRANGGSYTEPEWRALCDWFGGICLRCGSAGPLTVDHVLPVTKGGANSIDDLQPLCSKCNNWKKTKHIDYRDPVLLQGFAERMAQ